MTVFVVHRPGPPRDGKPSLDLTPAAQHGHVEFIFDPFEQTGLMPGQAVHKARRVLNANNFGPDDYLVWSGGDPASMFIAGGVALDMNRGKLNFLRWEREQIDKSKPLLRPRGGFYIPVNIRIW